MVSEPANALGEPTANVHPATDGAAGSGPKAHRPPRKIRPSLS